jgi:DNA-binding transcriptional LysR family regulator
MQQFSDIELSELQAFVHVAEQGSFVRAASRLDRDATVLSRRVSALEARLGVRLMLRTTRAIRLTEAGERLLLRAHAILQALEDAGREAAGFATGVPKGHLRLALPRSFGRVWLAPMLPEFLKTYPQITIEAEFSDRFVDIIGEGFDLAIRLGELTDSRLVVRKIGERGRMLCAAPSYLARRAAPAAPSDLSEHACLIFTGLQTPHRWELHNERGETARIAVTGPLAADDAEVLLQMAVAGAGILLATDWLAAKELAAGRLVRVLETWTVSDAGAIYMVTPAGSGNATKTRAFSDWVAARLQPPPWRTGRPKERGSAQSNSEETDSS